LTSAGALPQIPLGELRALPRPLKGLLLRGGREKESGAEGGGKGKRNGR